MGDEWTVRDEEKDNERTVGGRSEAEDVKSEMEALGAENVTIVPPEKTDGGTTTPEVLDEDELEYEPELADRSVGEDPLDWVPGEFVDEIDGSQAINRKGFEVLSHFYDVDVETEVQVPPEETDFTFCRCKATATMPEGRHCEAFGSAHVDRDDDPTILLEMADTRARKRALSIATGVGAVAVEELRSEVTGDGE